MTRIRTMVTAMITIALLSAAASSAATKLKLFILAGQSNSVGMGVASMLPPELRNPQPAVKFYPATQYDDGKPKIGWEALQPAYWCGRTAPDCQAGPYLTFGRDMAAALPNDSIAIVLIGIGNTTLASDWRPPSSGGPGQWYNNLINGTNLAISELGPNYTAEITGMLWMQGESDAFTTNDANAYQTNLTNFIKDVRASFNVPRMPFVIAQIDSFVQWTYSAIVREKQAATARTVANTAVFDTYHYPKNPDGGHYNYQGIQVIGINYAANMLRLMANPAPGAFVEPSDLTATTAAAGSVTLTWRDNSSTETGFRIERASGAGAFSEIGSLAPGTAVLASYTDQAASQGQNYVYRVRAVNGSASTAYSNSLAVSPRGTGTGLKAEYFKDTTLTTLAATRTDTTVNWYWGQSAPAAGIAGGSQFSVRWTGYVQPRYSENYTFFVESDMIARVWVNGQQIVNQWTWARNDIKDAEHDWANTFPVHCGSIRLIAGQVYPIKVEYYVTRNSYDAYCRLRWQSPVCQEMQVIPRSQLYTESPTVAAGRRTNFSRSAAVGVPQRRTPLVAFDIRGRVVRATDRAAASEVLVSPGLRGARTVRICPLP